MKERNPSLERRIENKNSVKTYIDRLKYALENGTAKIRYQARKRVDQERDRRYSNRYTVAALFPNEEPVQSLKRELLTLETKDYIETIRDSRFPNRSEMRVFGKTYNSRDVYVKIRVELCTAFGNDLVFVMSFHFAEHDFKEREFPYRS